MHDPTSSASALPATVLPATDLPAAEAQGPGPVRSSRRAFLAQVAAASAALSVPYFVPASALGLGQAVAPSERIVLGCIGTGGKGRNNLSTFMTFPDVQVVAVCDVAAGHLEQARQLVANRYQNQDCLTFRDFRELLTRADIDAVSVATPDHWHALPSIAAAKAGKDIYCEKPLANSVAEGRAICRAVQENQRILQTGSHERSNAQGRFACELVRNGRIGRLQTIRVNLPCSDRHHLQARELREVPAAQPVPEGFDYDFWLGHTALAPYHEKRCHFWWRFILAYGGGEMTDRGAHVIDLAQLGAGTDDTGPVEFEARGTVTANSLYDAYWDYQFENTFASGVKMIGGTEGPRGVKFEGTEGWIMIHVHGCRLEAEPASLLQEMIPENGIQLGRSPGHHRNFIDCVKSRQATIATAEIGHRTATICHLNNLAMRLGRKLRWNPQTEQVLDDAEANRLLAPTMRAPWSL